MFSSFKPADNEKDLLKQFGRNLNDEVARNKIDPIIGRGDEIRRLIEIISRKNKNNPVLIGEPGVGKTAIVEGFAQRIVAGDVPDNLKDAEIVELSLSSIVAGTMYHGQFEERLHSILKKVKESNGRTILFIDEIHQLVGMGKHGDKSGMDASNILKPMMARGEIRVIGATTLKEYREYIEKDGALERRMQKIMVNEPSQEEALTIMRGLKERWEIFHKVGILDNALIAAVKMSDRYISDHFLPDKAIDLIDEAAARIKTQMHSQPQELDTLNRNIIHLETELAALKKDTENEVSHKTRIAQITSELTTLKSKQSLLNKEWENQKSAHEKVNELKEKINTTNNKIEKYQMDGMYTEASKLLYVEMPKIKQELEKATETIKKIKNDLFKTVITENEIAEVISRSTGIPLNKLLESEKEKLLHLKQEMGKRVKGQDEALAKVANAVLRGRANINDPNRPIGSFLFLGPTGVGKTEVAKTLAFDLFDNEKAMQRFDMSEYMEKHSVSKLIGAPPGYVGYDQAGVLTEAVRRKPYSVVLFDEIEKAHIDVLNILLQILDDGRVTDGQGRVVNFKNTIIIMTSNIGSQGILSGKKEEAMTEIQKMMRPEFINRIDEVIIFNELSDKAISEIVERLTDELSVRLKAQDLNVRFGPNLKASIKTNGYDKQFGARPLKRYIQRNIENFLAEQIIAGTIKKNTAYELELDAVKKLRLAPAAKFKS
ncbi:ATP-dependent Clp protease ATP-binding subunit [[Mycoplasma] testudinis]|uniref:ATP-dependent Clp protease ATP-binding subunit n=1 Tax=[Mycoplasma] testudinis TaxID=33924 RepID=UPI000569A218|nr:AAA family ATPase [[Mycoplasma] testudinis]